MAVETAFELAFALGILVAAATLALAALERLSAHDRHGRRRARVGRHLGLGRFRARSQPVGRDRRHRPHRLCARRDRSPHPARGLIRGRAIDDQLERVRQSSMWSWRGARQRSEELEHALARARADAVSTFEDDQRRLGGSPPSGRRKREERARAKLVEELHEDPGRSSSASAWSLDLDRAEQASRPS